MGSGALVTIYKLEAITKLEMAIVKTQNTTKTSTALSNTVLHFSCSNSKQNSIAIQIATVENDKNWKYYGFAVSLIHALQ